ncbi:hypothetical protein ACH5RR_012648 [Cinchona calisaya]|uniref:Uncharacterized protein n=1 Tax=Cinchona calisaya TaxID=153742 RepID=A0ABD3AAZ4_9GENT
MFDLNEMAEFWREVFKNSLIYKEKTKAWHDKLILGKEFKTGNLVLLYNLRLKLFLEKLKSRWSGPFEVVQTFSHGVKEIKEREGAFKVNGHDSNPTLEESLKANEKSSNLCKNEVHAVVKLVTIKERFLGGNPSV